MIRIVIEVHGDEMETEVECKNLTEVEVGMLLFGLQQVKKEVMEQWRKEQ